MKTVSRFSLLTIILVTVAFAQTAMYDPQQQINQAIAAMTWTIIRMIMRMYFGWGM